MSIARALALNTVIQIGGKVASTITGIIIISLMTRTLGAEGFGAYAAANAFLQIFSLLMDVGINVTFPALLGEHADDEAFQKRAFSAIFTLRLLMSAAVLIVAAPLIALAWPFPWEIKLAVIALSFSFVFPNLQQIMIGVQQQRLHLGFSSIAENVGRLVNIAGLLLAPVFGWGLIAQCWIISTSSAIVFAINAWSSRRFLPLAWNWDPAFWLTTLKRSWPIGLSIALNLIYYKADTLVLQYYRPQAEVGWYGAAYRMLEVLISIPFLYAGLLLPILSKAWSDRRLTDLSQLISRSLDVMILLTLPLVVGISRFGERTLIWISGPDFAEAGMLARVLVFAVASIYFNTVLSYAIVALQAQRKMLPLYAFTAVFTLSGYILLIPRFGALSAAWLTVVSETMILIGSTLTVWGYVRFSPSRRLCVGTVASSLIMWIASRYFAHFPLMVGILMTGLVYVIALVVTRTLTANSLKTLFSVRDPGLPITHGHV